jgi:hypothetical protein
MPPLETEPGGAGESRRLTPTFIGILLVEAASIAALYWFGVHFGA